MKKGLSELVFILDRSGSMAGLETDTIGGFNGMLEKQKKQTGEANVTTVLFDDRYELIHDRYPITEVEPLTEKEYYVRGCTALLDAMGKTVEKMRRDLQHTPEEERAEKVIFVITTDGLENASREYSYASVKRLIGQAQKEDGWEFLFLGANMDAVEEAARFGIRAERAATYENDGEGIAVNYEAIGQALCSMRDAEDTADLDSSWKKDIEKLREKER